MTTNAGEIANTYPLKSGRRDRIQLHADIPIGGSGVVGTVVVDDPAITAAHGTAGQYTFTYPKAPSGRVLSIVLQSPASTVKTAWVTAFSPTAGTGTIVIGNGGGTATDPASGDVVYLTLELETRTD
ncbi:MAG: hypothetical protein WDO74_17955 [Pseudomonadota bacterium]